ncbi:hypothetical protein TNCV_468411 [Trichonephila clavipes]|nr:hypothetical protein TNCV_468411 [Trichonephila clavipes]
MAFPGSSQTYPIKLRPESLKIQRKDQELAEEWWSINIVVLLIPNSFPVRMLCSVGTLTGLLGDSATCLEFVTTGRQLLGHIVTIKRPPVETDLRQACQMALHLTESSKRL